MCSGVCNQKGSSELRYVVLVHFGFHEKFFWRNISWPSMLLFNLITLCAEDRDASWFLVRIISIWGLVNSTSLDLNMFHKFCFA